MHYVNGIIGIGFAVFALLHLTHPDWIYWMAIYSIGAILALATLKADLSLAVSRFLAIVTTVAMFFYFAAFFKMAPHLAEGWYHSHNAMQALGALIGAFAMIPVLSDYSCRLKADTCRVELVERRSRAFFSVPREIENTLR
jgi:4-amino-4-deoxy-L-arabinose transferase-like glycosyltransferase